MFTLILLLPGADMDGLSYEDLVKKSVVRIHRPVSRASFSGSCSSKKYYRVLCS
jgi:hypothetical protein